MRIVSLLPAATDIVASLGVLDQLVGRTHECDWPPDAVDAIPIVTATELASSLSSREISETMVHHGSSIYVLDQDALSAAKPDVILTQDLCDVCAVSYRSVNDAVRIMELDTTVVSLQPKTIDGVLTAIDTVAALVGAEDRAARITDDAHARLARLPGSSSGAPSVLFVEWLDPLMPGGHWVPEQIAYAGGRSLVLGPGQHSVPQLCTDVRELRPEVIVFGPCGFSPERTRAEIHLAQAWPGWSELPAVRSGSVWIVDGPAYFNRPGPRVIDGAEILASILGGAPEPAGAWRV